MKRSARKRGWLVAALAAMALCGGLVTAAPAAPFADNFERPDDTCMGTAWIEEWSDWTVEGGRARSAAGPGQCALMTVEGFQEAEPTVQVTVDYDGQPRPTYVALALLYLDKWHHVFVKIQDGYVGSPPDGLFDTAYFYLGNNGANGTDSRTWPGMGDGVKLWADLSPYFSTARLTAWVVGDEVFLAVDRDFDGLPDDDKVIARGGLPLAELGAGVGLGGYDAACADDFLALPEPATLVLLGLGAAVAVRRRR